MPKLPPSSHRNQRKTTNKTDPYRLRRENNEDLKKGKIRSGGRWQRVRELYLRRRPMCEDPHEIHERVQFEEAATEVHHIIRLQDEQELAFTFANLASLCSHCHAKISATERKDNRSAPEYFKERQEAIIDIIGEERYNRAAKAKGARQ